MNDLHLGESLSILITFLEWLNLCVFAKYGHTLFTPDNISEFQVRHLNIEILR